MTFLKGNGLSDMGKKSIYIFSILFGLIYKNEGHVTVSVTARC